MTPYNCNHTVGLSRVKQANKIMPSLSATGHLPDDIECRFHKEWKLDTSKVEGRPEIYTIPHESIVFFEKSTNALIALFETNEYFYFNKDTINLSKKSDDELIQNIIKNLELNDEHQKNIIFMTECLRTILQNFKSIRESLDYLDVLMNHDDQKHKIINRLINSPTLTLGTTSLSLVNPHIKTFSNAKEFYVPAFKMRVTSAPSYKLAELVKGEGDFIHLPAPDQKEYSNSVETLRSMGYTEPCMLYPKAKF